VTDPEPLPPDHALWGMPNVIITPHYAGDHPGYNREAFRAFVNNLGRYVRGDPLLNVVDREAGY
jgi:D-2-hydroxyacid dehydrogenase (NADP+)